MNKMKRLTGSLLAALVALTLLFGLAACGGDNGDTSASGPASGGGGTSQAGGDSSTPPVGGGNTEKTDETLTVAVLGEPTALSYLNGTMSNNDNYIYTATGGRLWELNMETMELEYSLATGYEAIDDTHYRVTLREDAVYSDGTPVTAADVAYSFGTAFEAGLDFAKDFATDEFVVEDDHNLIIAFQRYIPGWYNGLAEATAFIVSEAGIEAVGGVAAAERTPPPNCGRYELSEWKSGEYILLERNENYWDADYAGYYKYIKYIFVPDAASRLLSVKSGDAQIATGISISEAVTLQNDPGAKAITFRDGTVYNLYFNNETGIFTDAKVREATSYLIDSQSINALINMGDGTAVQGFIPKESAYYVEYFDGGVHPFDVEKGKQLLADAGYPDGFECYVTLRADSTLEAIAVMVQEMLRQGGIEMEIKIVDPSVAVTEFRAGNYDIAIGNCTNSFVTPDNFNLINPERVGKVIGGPRITDPAMDELIARATSPDESEAKQGWADIQTYLFGNSCLVGLCDLSSSFAVSPELEGFKYFKRQYIDVTEVRPAA